MRVCEKIDDLFVVQLNIGGSDSDDCGVTFFVDLIEYLCDDSWNYA